jgi:hypothetical protein
MKTPFNVRRLATRLIAVLAFCGIARAAETPPSSQRLLLIHDNATMAMPLVEFLKTRGHFDTVLVDQAHLPPVASWTEFLAVLGYVHRQLLEPTEIAIIDYTKQGGRFVALHHMISSLKAENRYFFDFLGVRLDEPKASSKPVTPGAGYGWYNGGKGEPGVAWTLVNLNPTHFIVSHDVPWDGTAHYQSSDQLTVARDYPAIVLPKSEAYVNVKFTDGREKTVLCGMIYTDPRNGAHFEQDRAAWCKTYGAGRIVYIQPGHFTDEYANPTIAQMVLNAIVWDGR